MNRLDFLKSSLALGAAAPWVTHPVLAASLRPVRVLQVDGARLNAEIETLRQFGGTPDGGTHRVAYSDEDLGAREWVMERMREAGLRTSIDPAGNLVGDLAGTDPGLTPIAIGSHIDTVPYGGSYDGTIGVLGAIEIVRTLQADGHRLRHPLRVYTFQNEEGGKTGSRLLIGAVDPSELDVQTASGFTIREGIARLGGVTDALTEAPGSTGDLAAFLELHIEQGATLERRGIPIGVVEGIVGIRRWFVTVVGEKNHAGTTPMAQRRDALVAASRMVVAVNETARTLEGRQVATVGRIEVDPGAPNVIPGSVRFTLEVRDLTMEGIDRVLEAVRSRAADIARESGTTVDFDPFYRSEAAPSAEALRQGIERAADGLGLGHVRMPSGAGHDAQSMAKLCPMGMVFVPSRGGVSHAPEEFTAPDQITAGVDVLLGALLQADQLSMGPGRAFDLATGTQILERTPDVLRTLLTGLSDGWTRGREGPQSWSPYDVVGHLVDGEEEDWIPRARIILTQGVDAAFQPFDRLRHLERSHETLAQRLDRFADLRSRNLAELRALDLKETHLRLAGRHPEFGVVTLGQLLATWVAHDLGHLVQISRTMAVQYRDDVGPWAAYLSVMGD